MYVSESHFPWLQRAGDARMEQQLEQRRVIAERLAEDREAAAGWTETAGRRGIRQLLPTRLLHHHARPAM
ncbi:hypothetical protein [Agromyces silvae]|uniref:hypothetical protein n=1 Tax=Agromyces silvae TaxID=3388266 RepID=UPI00280BC1E2|nr:hypothetical protein [Agromyces protaetiae]